MNHPFQGHNWYYIDLESSYSSFYICICNWSPPQNVDDNHLPDNFKVSFSFNTKYIPKKASQQADSIFPVLKQFWNENLDMLKNSYSHLSHEIVVLFILHKNTQVLWFLYVLIHFCCCVFRYVIYIWIFYTILLS